MGFSVMEILSQKMRDRKIQEEILEVFRTNTPGYKGQHFPAGGSEGVAAHEHPLPGTIDSERGREKEPYTENMANSWEFVPKVATSGGGEVGAVINTDPAAGIVESGWYSKRGIHVPGHYMAYRSVTFGGVREIYLTACNKALVTSLAHANYNLPKSSRHAASISRKTIASMQWKKGKVVVNGVLSGVTRADVEAVANNLADQIMAALGG